MTFNVIGGALRFREAVAARDEVGPRRDVRQRGVRAEEAYALLGPTG